VPFATTRTYGSRRSGIAVALLEHHLDLRPLVPEATHDLREQARAGGLEGPDAQDTRLATAQGVQVGLRGLEARDDRVRVAEQQLAGLGQ